MKRWEVPNSNLVIVGAEPNDIGFDSGRYGSFNITDITAAIERNEIPFNRLHIDFTKEDMERLIKAYDVDQERVKELLTVDRDRLFVPIIFVSMNDGQDCVIDGINRIAAYYALGIYSMVAYQLTEKDARKYEVRYFARVGKKMVRVPLHEDQYNYKAYGTYTDRNNRVRGTDLNPEEMLYSLLGKRKK